MEKGLEIGTWNVWSLHRSRSLKAAAMELARNKLVLVGVQEVRCDKGGNVKEGIIYFFY
jgi:exonuclease III